MAAPPHRLGGRDIEQKRQPHEWSGSTLVASPIYHALTQLLHIDTWRDWPDEAQLNALLDDRARTRRGQKLRFTLQADAGIYGAAAYESHIDKRGEIPLRPHSWHDLFNALMWALFPVTKSTLNTVHIQELAAGGTQRTRRRDAITLLDECGVLIPVNNPALTRLHAQHEWTALFVDERKQWGEQIEPMIIGHGLYEQCLQPYIGLTAKALHWPVPADWFQLSLRERYRQLDAAVADAIGNGDAVRSTSELLPLPILGIPGWWDDNTQREFYLNRGYFRPLSRT